MIARRLEESTPNVVLGTLALTVLLVTAGIVYTLADDGLGFIRSFACGHDDPKVPENWGTEWETQIIDHASYGSFTGARLDGSDGPSLDGLCIEHFDLNDDDLNEDWVWNASGIPLDQNDFGTWAITGVDDPAWDAWVSRYTSYDEAYLIESGHVGIEATVYAGHRSFGEASHRTAYVLAAAQMAGERVNETLANEEGIRLDWASGGAITWSTAVDDILTRYGEDPDALAGIDPSAHRRAIQGMIDDASATDVCALVQDPRNVCIHEPLVDYDEFGNRQLTEVGFFLRPYFDRVYNGTYGVDYTDSPSTYIEAPLWAFQCDAPGLRLNSYDYVTNHRCFRGGSADGATQDVNGKTEPGDLSRGWWEPVYIYECTMMVFSCDRNPAVIDDLDGDGIPNNASNIRGDRLDTDFDGDSPWGDVADPDLDNDGIPNAYERPGINEASGLDHELTVNLNTRGIILGVLTYLLVLVLFFLPMFTGRVTIETTEGLSGAVRTFGGYLMLLSVISIIPFVPTSGRGFLIVGLGVLAAAIAMTVRTRSVPFNLYGLALGILSMLIIPMYAVQTAHTILLGLTLILLSNALADGRNIAEGGGVPLVTLPRLRRVHMNADAMSLQMVILVGTFLLLIFDTTARVDGALGEFLTQTHWDTMVTTGTEITVQEHLAIGVNSLLQTTLFIAFGALIIALPLGVGMAIFLADYASPRIASIVKPVIEILAGIPSVVYGFVALAFLSPYVMDLGELFVERGLMADEPETFNALIGLTVVGVMITPFIASLSEDALRAVPQPLRNASYALGATKIETVRRVSIPAAISGIIASVVLAFSRAIGETMAVTLTAGTVAMFTTNPFLSQMTMTSFIANRVKGDLPIGTTGYFSIFAVGLYLFIVALGLNYVGHRIMTRYREAYE